MSLVDEELHWVIVVCLERGEEYLVERMQALKLIKKFMSIAGQLFIKILLFLNFYILHNFLCITKFLMIADNRTIDDLSISCHDLELLQRLLIYHTCFSIASHSNKRILR